MNVGTIGYSCHSGLGHLVKSFFDAGMVNRIIVIPHRHYPKVDWFPREAVYTVEQQVCFLRGLHVLLLFENAFHWEIAARAKAMGVKIILMPNYEYTPFPPPVRPDIVWCPSLLDRDYYRQYPTRVIFAPVETPWRLRERALIYVHNAGHGQRGWAKGTPQVLEAMRYVKSPLKLIVRGQPEEPRVRELLGRGHPDPRVEIRLKEVPDSNAIWEEGDVFVNAEQYNGMSLMLQEARAAGMLVLTTDRYPANTWLPKEGLIPVSRTEEDRLCVPFTRSICSPESIAGMMDSWYGRDITEYSLSGRQWGKEHNWQALRPQFLSMLEEVVCSRQ